MITVWPLSSYIYLFWKVWTLTHALLQWWDKLYLHWTKMNYKEFLLRVIWMTVILGALGVFCGSFYVRVNKNSNKLRWERAFYFFIYSLTSIYRASNYRAPPDTGLILYPRIPASSVNHNSVYRAILSSPERHGKWGFDCSSHLGQCFCTLRLVIKKSWSWINGSRINGRLTYYGNLVSSSFTFSSPAAV